MVTAMQCAVWGRRAIVLGLFLWAAVLSVPARESGPQPALRIPVEPLGYRPPGKIYLLARYSSCSLDFLDATHLLFTFRQPRLLARSQGSNGLDQFIHATVLELPTGKVVDEQQWMLHDRQRYLWPLAGSQAMLRIGDRLYSTDAKLDLKMMISSPTRLRLVETSPDGKMLTFEADEEKHTPEEHARLAQHAEEVGADPPDEDVRVRMVRLDELQLKLNARADHAGYLPATPDGFLSQEQPKPDHWNIRFHPFEKPEPTGGDMVAQIESTCAPDERVLSDQSVLVMSCPPRRMDRFVAAYTLKGQKLWDGRWQSSFAWPSFGMARTGASVAISWLAVGHPVNASDAFDDIDVQAQVLSVLDSRTGGLRLALPIDPIMSAGGNFALSPDGNRLAVLNHGAIEVYDLPQSNPPADRATK